MADILFDCEAAQSLSILARNDVYRAEFCFGCGLQRFDGGGDGHFAEQELEEKDVLKCILCASLLFQNRLRFGRSAAFFGRA